MYQENETEERFSITTKFVKFGKLEPIPIDEADE